MSGSFCWCCGRRCNPWWTDAAGVKRCDECHLKNAAPKPEHTRKLSEMDRLPMATPKPSP